MENKNYYIGCISDTNSGAYFIKSIDDDKIAWDICSFAPTEFKVLSKHKTKLYFDREDNAYFKHGSCKLFLNDAMRFEF